jgi:hypothetical protein
MDSFRKWLRSRPVSTLLGYLVTLVSVILGTQRGIEHPHELVEAIARGHILIVLIEAVPEFLKSVWLAPSLFGVGVLFIWWGRRSPDPSKTPPETPEVRLDRIEKSIGENLETRIVVLEDVARQSSPTLEGAGILVKEHHASISSLETGIHGVFQILSNHIPNYVLRQSELTELLDDNRCCRQEYMDLRAVYSDHPATSKPFARGWRPSLPGQESDEATKHYEQWAHHMEYHMNRLQAFSDDRRQLELPANDN